MNSADRKEGYGYLIDWIIRFGDLFIINIFFLLAYLFAHNNNEILDNLQYREKITAFLMINLCYFLASSFVRFHITSNIAYLDKIVQRSSGFITLYALLITVGFSIFNIISIPVIPWIVGFFILGALVIGWHVLFRVTLKSYRRKGYNYRQVVIIGAGSSAVKTYESLIFSDFGYKVLGFFDDDEKKRNNLPNYLGKISDLELFIENKRVDEVFCTITGNDDDLIYDLIRFSEKNMIRFHLVPEFHKYIKRRFSLHFIDSTPVLSLRYEPLQHFSNRFIKRTFDLIFSGLVLICVFPLIYLIFGIIIKRTSPGPIFFKQKRTGIKGKEFYCYKFRSMSLNEEANKKQATADDPRITKVGAFMRKTSIDELPQFINVFKNDMSVVGPRPHMLQHTDLYSSLIDKFMVRHLVKPGITGWAQVTGCRGETKTVDEMEERVKRDVWYLENWTFFLDLKIIYLTIANVFKGDEKAF
ncbi:undecaprenyl-phosphate glucose phosphotransferase [Prevotella sp. 10(H)]|uniref:undecaprenyl-phosphate glucose phosphotransferase n=1 Tax=Prevotella sp. 10(H) TaxID=1158294 RepID=UPI0004A6B416|nr:undecaprenyl-phosphate glucose phosphotransferase [Prevotella sp. 10(H)]